MARLFEEDREEVWRGIKIVLALFILVNDWARSSPILDEFAKVHGFDHEHVQIVFRIVVILICVFLLVLFEMALRRNAAKIACDRSGLKIFERAWAQNSSIDERPYSLSVIRFSGGRWEYVGVGFDKNFALAAEGNTQSLFYNNSRREWVFGGPAWLRTYDARIHGFPRTGGQGSVTPILHLPPTPIPQ